MMCSGVNPSSESLPPGLEIALILMDKEQSSSNPRVLDHIKSCDDVWELLCREETNICGPMVARIAPIVARVDPEYLNMDEWPWATQVPEMMEPYRHHACEWLAQSRVGNMPSFKDALAESVIWAKNQREDACTPYVFDPLGEYDFDPAP